MENQRNDSYNNCKTEPSVFSSQTFIAQKKKNEYENLSVNKDLLINKNRHFNGRLYERIGNSKQNFIKNFDKNNEIEINSSKFINNNNNKNNKIISKNESYKMDSNFYSNYILTQQEQEQKQKKSLTIINDLIYTKNKIKIISDLVLSSLNIKNDDLYLKFLNYFSLNNLNDSLKKNNIIKNYCENEFEFCHCKEHRFLAFSNEYFINNNYDFDLNIDYSENCRKRKTSGRTDILEKRYCCEDDDNNLILTDCLEKKLSNCSNELIKIDENNNKKYMNFKKFNNNKLAKNDESNKSEIKSKELNIEELFVQQYQRNYHHFLTNFKYYQQNFKQTIKYNDNTEEQIVPMTSHNHFVNPIVGLMAEMPSILLF